MENNKESTKKVVYREKVSEAAKTKNWHIAKAQEIDQTSSYHDRANRLNVNYDLINGILNQEDFEYVTKPYGITPKAYLPEEMQNFPIITSNFKYLEGEMLKRPDNIRIYSVNPEAIQEFNKKKGEITSKYVIDMIKKARLEEAIAANPELQENQEELAKLEQEIMSPQEQEKYLRKFRDSYETMVTELYNELKQSQDLKEKFRKAFKHGMISGWEVYHVGIENKNSVLRVTNPKRFRCDLDPDLDYIHNAEWAVTTDFMNPSRVITLYGDYLTKAEEQSLYARYGKYGVRHKLEDKWEIESDLHNFLDNDWSSDWTEDDSTSGSTLVEVSHYVWRSWYKVGILSYMDENGEIQEMEVPEGYKLNEEAGDINIDWEWLPEIREITRIDEDIWVKYQAVEKFYENPDDPYDCPLPYTGVIHNNLNSRSVSPVDLMKPFQYFYNIVYRLIQRDLSSDKGKKLVVNLNQIPVSSGIDLQKWTHYLNTDDLILIDPNEEGNRGNTDLSSWKSIDMTAAQSINQKVQLLEYIEGQCAKVIGMNDARMGTQGNRELVGTTQQQIIQSNYTTEPWFATHEVGKKQAITLLLNVAKYAVHKYGKSSVAYVASDLSKRIIELDVDKIKLASVGVYVSSSSDDLRMYEELKQLAHAAVQTQSATLSSIAKLIRGQASPGELVETLEKGEARIMQNQAEQAQAEREMKEQIEAQRMKIEQDRLALEKYKADLAAQTALHVAYINSFRGKEDQDIDANAIPDQLELEKFRSEHLVKLEELSQKAKDLESNISLKERDLDIKEEAIRSKERIENLKAKTALKNKTAGEK